ncbi:hypothetical protein GQ53DRAFT_775181 [Thozetella sp. PMI_491]|nr:hypothetical protein GQ53DRAFT_775181 [Thozetella sp. PMI_491]
MVGLGDQGTDQAIDIIRLGGIAVITAATTKSKDSEIHVQEAKQSISPVDLLSCQLDRVQLVVNSLYPKKKWPVPFWIDTICVPSTGGRAGAHDVRSEALVRMEQAYQASDKVLVLDANLQEVSLDSDPEELLARIRYSRWNRRLWTSQEGALPKQVYFQLAGGTVTVESLIREYKSRHYNMRKPFGLYPIPFPTK